MSQISAKSKRVAFFGDTVLQIPRINTDQQPADMPAATWTWRIKMATEKKVVCPMGNVKLCRLRTIAFEAVGKRRASYVGRN